MEALCFTRSKSNWWWWWWWWWSQTLIRFRQHCLLVVLQTRLHFNSDIHAVKLECLDTIFANVNLK
jgi:hypothetical protein